MEDVTTSETVETNGSTPPVTWSAVAEASREVAAREPKARRVYEAIKVPVTDVAKAKIADDNAADDLEKQQLEAKLETLKAEVKDLKSDVDKIEQRMSARHEAVRVGVQDLKGEWTRIDLFDTNTVRYVDPNSGVVVHERPMTAAERQTELFGGTSGTESDAEDDDVLDEEDVEAIAADDDGDDTTSFANHSQPDVTDPEALLSAAANPQAPTREEPPSKPTRRRKKDAS